MSEDKKQSFENEILLAFLNKFTDVAKQASKLSTENAIPLMLKSQFNRGNSKSW